MTWEIEVGRAGRYEATVWYTCPEGQTGSVIALSFAGQSVEATVKEAHNPPLEGEAEDRVKRTESYVKRFRPLTMGTVEFQKTSGTLTLHAKKVAAQEVADVRYVSLRLV